MLPNEARERLRKAHEEPDPDKRRIAIDTTIDLLKREYPQCFKQDEVPQPNQLTDGDTPNENIKRKAFIPRFVRGD